MATHANGAAPNGPSGVNTLQRSNSISQASESSQTAQEHVFYTVIYCFMGLLTSSCRYIRSQLQLELDAREALPYQFDTCTKPLGPLRQTVFSCLTCNPPSSEPNTGYSPAGVCYSCSISCHGEHELVELFARRNFECDCGTSRLPSTASCSLRLNAETGLKGGVHSEKPASDNKYNHNYKNRFCGCGETYDPHTEKGTMFQCLGLASEAVGGCGEDWWHPECLLGLPRNIHAPIKTGSVEDIPSSGLSKIEDEQSANVVVAAGADGGDVAGGESQDDDLPLPAGFPDEDTFEHLICYKCVDAVPWIKAYAGASGFLPAALHASISGPEAANTPEDIKPEAPGADLNTKKRKADDDDAATADFAPPPKKQNTAAESVTDATSISSNQPAAPTCTYPDLPPSASFKSSLFLTENFRSHLCRCPEHFPLLTPLPFLLEEEETYEPPVSEGSEPGGNGTHGSEGSRSLYDRGEAALSAVDRVRAIEGVMAYNHLRDKVKGFLKPFAESGTPVGAEDVKAYFEKLRGDDLAMKQAQAGQTPDTGGNDGDKDGSGSKEQGGY